MRGETGLNFGTSREGRGLRSPSFIGMSKDCNFCQPPPRLSSCRQPFGIKVFPGLPISRSSGPVASSGRTWRSFFAPGDGCRTKQNTSFCGANLGASWPEGRGAQFFPIPRGHSSDRRATLFATLRSPLTSTSTTATIPSCLSPSSLPPLPFLPLPPLE